jgi:hypothetical protein
MMMVWVIAVPAVVGCVLGLYFQVYAVALASVVAIPVAIWLAPLVDVPHPMLVVPGISLLALQAGFLAGAVARALMLRLRSLYARLQGCGARRR